MTDRTYAIADLHGRFDLLTAALEAIDAKAPAGAGQRTAVFLGDYIDRGPESRQVLERLMSPAPPGWRWVCLKGNHEAMMCDAFQARSAFDHWVGNGGWATLDSFVGGDAAEPIPEAVLDWAQDRPLLYADRHRVFVHAGVDPDRPLQEQREEDLLWMRNHRAGGYGDRHVVHGHTPHAEGPVLLAGRTNLDTLAWETGRLVIGVFDDARAGGPIDLIEVRCRAERPRG